MLETRPENIGDLPIYKMLSDETKLRILKILSNGERCVGELTEEIGVSQTLISHKLRDLRENGLVSSAREGKKIVYRISHWSLSELLEFGEKAGDSILKACNCVECDTEESKS